MPLATPHLLIGRSENDLIGQPSGISVHQRTSGLRPRLDMMLTPEKESGECQARVIVEAWECRTRVIHAIIHARRIILRIR